MIQSGSKPKWWLPLLMLFTPGSCYLYAAFFPSLRLDFVIFGLVIISVNTLLATWRFLNPKRTDTHIFRMFAAQGFTLAALLISIRFWMAFSAVSPIFISSTLLIIYILVWSFPFFAPSSAQRLYHEFWFPRNKLMRLLVRITLIIGGGGGAMWASIGKNIPQLGNFAWLIMAILTTAGLLGGTFYISSYLWQQHHNFYPTQPEDE